MISLSTLFGIVFGVGVIVWGVLESTSNWIMFFNLHGAAIVIGGTITSAFIGFRWRYILNAFKSILIVFVRQKITPKSLQKDVETVLEWTKHYQKEGPSALEKIGNENKEPFIKYVVNLINSGYPKEHVREFAETSIEEHYYRHLTETSILASMAGSAPAFGMVGTLIGMIVMLSNMQDPSQMGPGLSMALIATLYGVLIARLVFLPTSTKMKQLLGIQRFREFLLLEGFILMMEKRSTFFIQDKLNSFLDRSYQYSSEPKAKK